MKLRNFSIRIATALLVLTHTSCSLFSDFGSFFESEPQQDLVRLDKLPKRITTIVVVNTDNVGGVDRAARFTINAQLEKYLGKKGFTVVTMDKEVPQMIEYSRGSGTREEGAVKIGEFLNANAILMVSILELTLHQKPVSQYVMSPNGGFRLENGFIGVFSMTTSVKIVETETAEVLWADVFNDTSQGTTGAYAVLKAADLVGRSLPVSAN
ncbi:hypothetical protein AAFN60_19000 [Roseibacillus persicicus]|uniref:hypothetical protein n=1 Tax=Roseibacillus persicicus TaxID=454148 RepID=UPI00398AFC37